MITIGLTGGIACGKSKALEYFKNLNIYTIDADQLAHEAVEPGNPALDEIANHFGRRYIHPDGSLNRDALADLVFSKPEALKQLNRIVHPYVLGKEKQLLHEYLKQDQTSEPRLIVIDAPLMIEVGTYKRYDVILVIYCPPSLQMQRLLSRKNITMEQAENRLRSQMSALEKVKYCDYVINSSGPVEETREQINFIIQELKHRYREGSIGR
jgi:dephospho-CoA kinase